MNHPQQQSSDDESSNNKAMIPRLLKWLEAFPRKKKKRFQKDDEEERNEESTQDEKDVKRLKTKKTPLWSFKSKQPGVKEILTPPPTNEDPEENWITSFKNYRVPPGWIILASLLLMALLVKSTLMIIQGVKHSNKVSIIQTHTLEEDKKDTLTVKDAMLSSIGSYLSATTLDEKIRFVRDPKRVRPMMERYYQSHPITPQEFSHIDAINFVSFWSKPFVLLTAELESGKKHFLTLEQTGDHTFRVDWETDVYYLPVPWDEFIEKRPTTPTVMRLRVRPDEFYGFAFRDQSTYECFHLMTRDSPVAIFGYAKRGSPVWKDLRTFFELRRKSNPDGEPLMLQIQYLSKHPMSSTDHSVLIEKFISNRWLYVDRKH